jgi:hypothetical protein
MAHKIMGPAATAIADRTPFNGLAAHSNTRHIAPAASELQDAAPSFGETRR